LAPSSLFEIVGETNFFSVAMFTLSSLGFGPFATYCALGRFVSKADMASSRHATKFMGTRYDSPVYGATVGSGKQRVLAVELDRADRSFNRIVVEFDAAVIDEAREPCQRGSAYRMASASLVLWLIKQSLARS
jgi:hypothetical protein